MALRNTKPDEIFNIKDFIQIIFNHKYYYIGTIILCVLIAYAYNSFIPKVYQVNSLVGPIEDRQAAFLESNEYFNAHGRNFQQNSLENDISSIHSFDLVSKTLKKLGLETSYYEEPISFLNNPHLRFLSNPRQLYKNCNYSVNIDKSHPQAINTRFKINIIDEEKFRLTISEYKATLYNFFENQVISNDNIIELDTICRFNQMINTPYFKFSVSLDKNLYRESTKLYNNGFFVFNHIDIISKDYLKRLTAEPASIRSTLIQLSFQGENNDLTVDFLNNYLQLFLHENLSKKNNIALNTINFIDDQLAQISDSLNKSESKLRDYKAIHQVTDLTYQGQQVLSQITGLENEISVRKVQEKYFKYILRYFHDNQDIGGLVPPTAANVNDPIMNSMVLELLELNAEKFTILSNKVEKSLFLDQLNNKIKLQKQTIIENVQNNLNSLGLTLNELNYRRNKLLQQIATLPKTELKMVSMQRQFNITDAMYTFLLQKRSEAAISMASNIPDYEILEPARLVTSSIISPKTFLNYILALFIGFFLPSLILIIKDFLNQNISSVQDLEKIYNKPITNLIYTNYHNSEIVSTKLPNSSLAESFRNLRSNIFQKLNSNVGLSILITSALPKDGKSFIAYNLAAFISAVGYKTIILDCDLRKPTLHKKLNDDNLVGLSNYMNSEASKEEIIKKTDLKNLYYITAGPIIHNASESIEAGKLDELMNYILTKFDYVIIDSTPSGIVSDSISLSKYASLLLFICRNNYTNKKIFVNALNNLKANKINNIEIVFNDLDLNKSNYKKYNRYYNVQ